MQLEKSMVRAALAVFCALAMCVSMQAQSTTWTGAVSTDWSDAGNWSNGVPDASTSAIIAAVGLTPQAAAPSAICGGLDVVAGASLQGHVAVYGNASIAADVNGTLEFPDSSPSPASARQIVCAGGAKIATLLVGDYVPIHTTDLYADHLDTGYGFYPVIQLHGTTTLDTAMCGRSVACVGAIYANSVVAYADFGLPATVAIGYFDGQGSSSIGSSTGVIKVPPGYSTTLDASMFLWGALDLDVASGASFSLTIDDPYMPPAVIHVVEGGGDISLSTWGGGLDVTVDSIAGELDLGGPNVSLARSSSTAAPNIAPGGKLEFDAYCDVIVHGDLQVEGDLIINGQLVVGAYGAQTPKVEVLPGGSLAMDGGTLQGEPFSGVGLIVQGEIAARSASFKHVAPALGVTLAAASAIAPAPDDLASCTISSSQVGAGSALLTIERLAPTAIDGLQLDGSTTYGVRATSPFPVTLTGATGTRSGEAWEDDPYGVVSWDGGVTWSGGGTTSCSPLAVGGVSGAPVIGNQGFAFTCKDAPAGWPALFALGTPSAVGFAAVGVQVHLDPQQPILLATFLANGQGDLVAPWPIPSDPSLVGVSHAGQWLLLEPSSCAQAQFATSNAVTVTYRH